MTHDKASAYQYLKWIARIGRGRIDSDVHYYDCARVLVDRQRWYRGPRRPLLVAGRRIGDLEMGERIKACVPPRY